MKKAMMSVNDANEEVQEISPQELFGRLSVVIGDLADMCLEVQEAFPALVENQPIAPTALQRLQQVDRVTQCLESLSGFLDELQKNSLTAEGWPEKLSFETVQLNSVRDKLKQTENRRSDRGVPELF